MRIISGDFGGRVVTAPKELICGQQPIEQKKVYFIFSTTNSIFSEVSLLDLFAGIGSISLECASRGSSDIVSVEKNGKHAAFIKQTAAKFGIKGMRVLNVEVRDFLKIANREFAIVLPILHTICHVGRHSNAIYASKVVGPIR
jgi:16S rRNA G966 N2-methylase RsmD